MAARRVWTKGETMKLVSLYAQPEIWHNRYTRYKGEKRDVLVFNRRSLERYLDWSAAKNSQPPEIHWLCGAAYVVLMNTSGDLFVWGSSRAMTPHSWGLYITHNDAPQSVGLLWTTDQLVTETSDYTQHLQRRENHATDGIRTHNLSSQAAADLRVVIGTGTIKILGKHELAPEEETVTGTSSPLSCLNHWSDTSLTSLRSGFRNHFILDPFPSNAQII